MLFCLAFIYFACSKYLEYRLSENYGQIIYDFSLNERYAINGWILEKDPSDCLYTDRGLYLSNNQSHLKFPPNSSDTKFISFSYQMIFWINIHKSGRIAFRFTPKSSWVFYILPSNELFLKTTIDYSTYFEQTSSSSITLEKWIFLAIKVSEFNIAVLINGITDMQQTFLSKFEEDGDLITGIIGVDINYDTSYIGFIWYLAILEGENLFDYIHQGSSNNCLSGDTCSCNPAIKLDSNIGCVTSETDFNLNAKGQKCTYSQCSGGLLHDCECNSLTCYFSASSHCDCLQKPQVSKSICFCPDGLSCCNPGCSKCQNLNLCTVCQDPNAEVSQDSRCYCKKGYFGPGPLNSLDKCFECRENCDRCTSLDYCLECKLKRQIAVNGKCKCIQKFFMNQTLECEACHKDCFECLDSITCSRCLDENSQPGTVGCDCVTGYWKNISNQRYKCEKCSDLCKVCNESQVCLECVGQNVVKNSFGMCECVRGFYLNYKLQCEKCPDYCEECLGISDKGQVGKCITCIKNYEISKGVCKLKCGDYEKASSNSCLCIKGYIRFEKNCIPDSFRIKASINLKNKVSLSFKEELIYNLSKNSFNIETKIKKFSFTFEKLNNLNYDLKFSFFENIEYGTPLKIVFKLPLINKMNQYLNESEFQLELNEYIFISENKENIIDKTKKTAKYSNSVSIFLSMFANPSTAWLLINTLQIIYFLPLSQAPLSPAVDEFCKAVSEYSLVPNVPELIFKDSHSSMLDEQAKKIGITSSLIWINIGSELTLLVSLLILWLIFWIVSKFDINLCKMKLTSILSSYKYSVFLRFWLQNHLIIGIYSFIHKNTLQKNDTQLSIFSSILLTTLIVKSI